MPPSKPSSRPLRLTSFPQMRALAHPVRFRAFECLIEAPRTGKQLAELLGKKPTHMYHHLGVLERAGLVRRVASRKKRGTTERYYRAVAERVVLDQGLFRGKAEAQHAILGQVLRTTFEEIIDAESVAAEMSPKPPLMVKRLRIRATSQSIGRLERRLEQWLSDFEEATDPQAAGSYAVTVALYPTRGTEPP